MKTLLPHSVPRRAILGAAFCALSMPMASFATLKYQPGDYAAQDALVVHLDGIANAGVGKPHDPAANVWANLADPANPAKFFAYSSSCGWRNGTGYYFNYDGNVSYAQLTTATPAMTQATFEFAFEGSWSAQTAKNWGPTFIAGANNHNISLGTAASPLYFRSVNWTGTTGAGNGQEISNWSWKQASFTFGAAGAGGLKSYDQGVQNKSANRPTATEGSIPATQWVVGSRLGETDAGRQLTGTMKSVRIYNRALSADEVAQNAAIDAARFEGVMPVTNAVVATSVAGAFGREVPGVYAVDGSHVFTAAPSAKVGSTTYACTGCTIETWENGAWSSPVTRDGVFAVEVSESEKVKIIWNWASTSATLNRYATDGLVVWLDGIWNAGIGKPHNASATTWANLANPANNAAITANASSGWRDDGYYFCYASAASYAQLASAAPAMTQATFEFAVDATASGQTGDNKFNWGTYFITGPLNNGICFFDNAGTTLAFNANNWTGGASNDTRPQMKNWSWKQASFTLGNAGENGFKAYDSGTEKVSIARTTATEGSIPATRWVVASRYSEHTERFQVNGTMKSVRIYNRALSPGEVAQNAAADAARFEGTAATAVEVVADPRGLEGREPAGMYFPEGWTFSSGVSTKTVGSVEYAPAGYVVETYDSTLSSWVVSERVARDGGNAVEWTSPTAPYATYRLTWLWEPVSGIRRAADYDVGDYVQGGLVAWLDGIRNTGTDKPHDSAATTWVDLSSRASDVTLSANSATHWTDDGYHFCTNGAGARSYAYLRDKLSLGTVGTIEMACDVKAADQIGDWPAYVSFNSDGSTDYDMSIHQYRKENYCRWKPDNWSGGGNRANITPPWDGRHAAFVMDTAQFRSYKRGSVDQTQARATVKAMPAVFWMVGSKFNSSDKDHQLTGTMKAVRAYNRVLSDDEIAHNYKVDVARFDGALAATNVVVAASDYNGDLAADAYEVYGSHVFEGASSAMDGSMPNRVKVWTLENGAWVLSETIDGPAYTYTAGTSPATVKIEFGKANPFVLVVR